MTPPRQIRNLALIGFMGCGKSSIGRLVAARLGLTFADTDHLIEEAAGQPIAAIFASAGEAAFRTLERQIIASLADRENLVISTGGGVGANPELLDSLKTHALVVWLWASPETLWERVRHQTHRPLLQVPDPEKRLRELLAERQEVYRQADVLLNADTRRLAEVADHVLLEFQRATAGPRHP